MSANAITVRGLRKRYGELEAVRGLDLEVRAGEVLAFIGPRRARASRGGTWPSWGVAGLLFALRFFRWSPKR